ncbi:cob(I)yrinic acid a,c-diamide adenosyltransferase [Pectinatus haikarae]|uniref:Cob(I)alamin adenosyltransferase n=1 Tax=Pectinatus haikarae TaxID=349096 RepID=A0ABT9Y613_9FIRM|nr:cob(I)yrinic acid a,c-diamide adenosyltransferase [Pectinatus haikarae]MDQ0203154.1 cob(I)alamin adenosyltransferase [Pectinatus haikarae]
MQTKGLVIVNTGNGKGKTTAALGLALRAWGQHLRVLIIQFIKGGSKYGELEALRSLPGNRIEIVQMGEGFTRKDTGISREEHIKAARDALNKARDAEKSGLWDMLILDEINYAVKFGLLDEQAVLCLLADKPETMHLVLTGRDAAEAVTAKADLVTEMREIKHPYKAGIKAQKGIEF